MAKPGPIKRPSPPNLLADISGGAGFQFNKMNLDVGFMNLGAAGYVV